MFNRLHFRIDMSLTDEYVLKTISELIPEGTGQLQYDKVAEKCKCSPRTVHRSVRRLRDAGRLQFEGGSGRNPVTYTLVKYA